MTDVSHEIDAVIILRNTASPSVLSIKSHSVPSYVRVYHHNITRRLVSGARGGGGGGV